MSGGHDHGHGAVRAGARHKRRLLIALALVGSYFVVEVIAGFATNSLALLSDAGHMLTDVLGLAMAVAAIHLADRGSTRTERTFGLYRLEILAALANAVLLFGVAIYVLFEAITRLGDPPEVLGTPMLVVAVVGLAVNVAAFRLLRGAAEESLNVRGAYLEVLSDMLGSVGVIVAGVILALTDWSYVDPIVGVGIGVFILPRTWRLAAQALRILVQAAPEGIDIDTVRDDLAGIEGVTDVHDLHMWTLTSEMDVASAHLMVVGGTDTHRVLDQARVVLADKHGVSHATLQVEPDDHEGCDTIGW